MTNYRKKLAWLLGGWFVLAVTASALEVFKDESSRVGIEVAVAAIMPLLVFAVWFAWSTGFREFALSLSPRWLTLAQSWRILGVTFVILHAYGVLPGVFALPAGYGDMATGATAPIVALKLAASSRRTGFLVWQVLGLLDLVMAVGLGVAAGLIDPSVSMVAMTVLPLSLVPVFFVPLLFIFHVICIAQVVREARTQGTVEAVRKGVATGPASLAQPNPAEQEAKSA